MASQRGVEIYDPRKLHLTPLKDGLTEADLRAALETLLGADHGIHAVSGPLDRGFGFVEFVDEAKAAAAKGALDGVSVAAISGGDNDAAAPPLRASQARDREAERRADREARRAAELQLPPLPPDEELGLDTRPWRERHPVARKALWAMAAVLVIGLFLGAIAAAVRRGVLPDGRQAATELTSLPRPADASKAPTKVPTAPAPAEEPPTKVAPAPEPVVTPPAPPAPPATEQPTVVVPPLPADGTDRARVNFVVETTGTPPPAIGVAVWTGEPAPVGGNVSVTGWRPVNAPY